MSLNPQKYLKSKVVFLTSLFCTVILIGCGENRYQYTVSLQLANNTKSSLSGTLLGDRNPSELPIDLEPGGNWESNAWDAGYGPNQTPPFGHDVSYIRAFHITSIDNEEVDIFINTKPSEKWGHTTPDGEWEWSSYKSTAIYTFSITEDHLKP